MKYRQNIKHKIFYRITALVLIFPLVFPYISWADNSLAAWTRFSSSQANLPIKIQMLKESRQLSVAMPGTVYERLLRINNALAFHPQPGFYVVSPVIAESEDAVREVISYFDAHKDQLLYKESTQEPSQGDITPDKRSPLNEKIHYLYEINDSNLNSAEVKELIHLYSRYKFGCRETISYFSKKLALKIVQYFGAHLENTRSEWVIVTSQYNEMPSASHAVSIEVSQLLGLPFVTPRAKWKDSQNVKYSELATKESRLESRRKVGVFFDSRDAEVIKGRKVILIDDLINSGATVENIKRILRNEHGVRGIDVFSLVSLNSSSPSLEAKINDALLNDDQIDHIVRILSDPNTVINRTSLKSLFNLPFPGFQNIIKKLPYHVLRRMLSIAKKYYDQGAQNEKNLSLEQEIKDRENIIDEDGRVDQTRMERIVDALIDQASGSMAPEWMVYKFRPGILQVNKEVMRRKVSLAMEHLDKATNDEACKRRVSMTLDVLVERGAKSRLTVGLFEGITNALIKLLTHNEDAYSEIKEMLDRCMIGLYDDIHKTVIQNKGDEKEVLKELMLNAGVVNLLDLSNPASLEKIAKDNGIMLSLDNGQVDPEGIRELFAIVHKKAKVIVDEFDKFYRIMEKNHGGTILYFIDNHGEVVIDQLVIEHILKLSGQYKVVVVGRGETVREDATALEAKKMIDSNPNLEEYVRDGRLRIVTDGSYCLGADLRQALGQPDFIKAWTESFAFISKGSGNFQNLFGQQLSKPGLFIRMMKTDSQGLGYKLLSKIRQMRFNETIVSPYNEILIFQPKSLMYDMRNMIEQKLVIFNGNNNTPLSMPDDIKSLYDLLAKAALIYENYGDFDIRKISSVWSVIPPEKTILEEIYKLETGDPAAKTSEILDAIAADMLTISGEPIDVLNGADKKSERSGTIDRSIAEYCQYIHQTTDAFVLTPDMKRLVLTRRVHNKKQYPLCLTVPGGHLRAGQSYKQAITEELKEELGLDSLKGRLREVDTYPYGFSDRTKIDRTKERRKLFVYQLSESEYENIRMRNIEMENIAKDGYDSYAQWLEARQVEGAGEVWSYHEIEMSRVMSANKKAYIKSPYEDKNTRFLPVKDIVTGQVTEVFFTPDLLDYVVSDNELLSKVGQVIEKLNTQKDTDAYFVEVHPTNICNLSCKGCVYASLNRDVEDRSTLAFKDIDKIAELRPAFVKIVGGGEPTLYRDSNKNFNSFVLRLKELLPGTSIGMTTNGIIFPDGDWQSKLDWVSISVHGFSNESFVEFTGTKNKKMFDHVMSNIFNKYYLTSPIPDIRVKFVYSEDNVLEIVTLARKLYEKWREVVDKKPELTGTKKLEFILQPYADDDLPGDPFKSSNISHVQLEQYDAQLKSLERDEPELWKFIKKYAPDMLTRPFKTQAAPCVDKCWMASKYVLIGADGFFYPCCIMAGVARENHLGRTYQSVEELLQKRWKMFYHPPLRCRHGCRPVNTYTGRMIGQMLEQEGFLDIEDFIVIKRDKPETVQEVFAAVDIIVDSKESGSLLKTFISRLTSECQKIETLSASKLRLCIPFSVFKRSPDVMKAFRKLASGDRLRGVVPVELIVTGVSEKDADLVKKLNRPDFKLSVNLPEILSVSVIEESAIQKRAQLAAVCTDDEGIRTEIIKNLMLEMNPVRSGEHMAIVTNVVNKSESGRLRKKLRDILDDKLSIYVLSRPEGQECLFSLSQIFCSWLQGDMDACIDVIQLEPITSREMMAKLEAALETAWRVLSSA